MCVCVKMCLFVCVCVCVRKIESERKRGEGGVNECVHVQHQRCIVLEGPDYMSIQFLVIHMYIRL